jgi:DNA-binding LytR/AlgR family response regulator
MKIRTIIVDDEPHAIEVIETYLKGFDDVEIVGTCADGFSAFRLLQHQKVDLAFLDVKMPGLTGTDLVKSLKHPPKVIFTTAYQDYAVEGFELNAVDYLMKPVSFDRFLKAMDKVYYLFGMDKQQTIVTEKPQAVAKDLFLYLRVDRKMVKVDVKEILWVESQKDYIKVVLKDRELISKQKISLLEELLPEETFIRIHRSFIVAMDKIESYNSYSVGVGGKELPIGRNYKIDTQKRLRV